MTKLQNISDYQNPNFKPEFGEYLLSNNFRCSLIKNDLYFSSDSRQLIVRGNNLDVYVFTPENEREEWVFSQCHAGIEKMDLFKWMMLMHCMDVISLQQFLRNARAKDQQHYTEAMLLIKSVLLTGTNVNAKMLAQ